MFCVILFILSVYPSSFLLSRVEGGFKITDLKLLARSLTKAKLLLDIITTFSNDIGMTFGQTKCAYIYIERGKRKSLGRNIEINGLSVRELKDREQYTYLGQDESVGFDGPFKKTG